MGRGGAVVAACALLAAGCSPVAQNARGRTALESRASFDLECPRNALALAPLGKDAHGVITSYGVEGCGRRATYVRLSDATWLMNPPGARAPEVVPRPPPMRVPLPRPPEAHPPPRPVPVPPRPAPSAEPAPSGSVERGEEPRPPSSLHPRRGEPEPRLPDLPGQGERPKPLGF